MKECTHCKVSIFDETNVCPLCHQVLTGKSREGVEPVYPDLRRSFSVVRLLGNILLFLSILAESTIWGIEILRDCGHTVGLTVGMILVYVNVVLRLSVIGSSGYLFKGFSAILFTVAVLYGIDVETGYKGWSMEFGYPTGIILLNLGIMLLMIINRRNWQSYIMLQIAAILLSILPLILWKLEKINYPYVAFAAFGLSVFYFLGTVIIGDYRARTELRRRFHI